MCVIPYTKVRTGDVFGTHERFWGSTGWNALSWRAGGWSWSCDLQNLAPQCLGSLAMVNLFQYLSASAPAGRPRKHSHRFTEFLATARAGKGTAEAAASVCSQQRALGLRHPLRFGARPDEFRR